MSMPLIYTFYRVTRNGEPTDYNAYDKKDPECAIKKITSCFSDRFTSYGPETDDEIIEECFKALSKLARFVDEGKFDIEAARQVNAIGIERLAGSFNELSEAVSSGRVSLDEEERRTITRVFPALALEPR